MRIIIDCLWSTNLQWFLVHLNLASPSSQRHIATVKILQKINKSVDPPVYDDINNALNKINNIITQ